MALQEGKPIWVESLMSPDEIKEYAKKYSTCQASKNGETFPEFDCEFKWRKGMGQPLSKEEIELVNSRLDAVLKKAGIVRQNQNNGTQ